MQKELQDLEMKYSAVTVEREEQVASYHKIRQQLETLGKELLNFIRKPQYLLPFLQPGRLIKVIVYKRVHSSIAALYRSFRLLVC
jgi:ATP-dependent RNA helicase DOB1